MLTAALLACIGALFGFALARLLWAEDLTHTMKLKKLWDQQEVAMEKTIDIQRKHIDILKGNK